MNCCDCVHYKYERDTGMGELLLDDCEPDNEDCPGFEPKMTKAEFKAGEEY